MTTITIYAVNSVKGMRYYVEYPEGKLHILNHRSLEWNLRKVFGLSKDEIRHVLNALSPTTAIRVALKDERAA